MKRILSVLLLSFALLIGFQLPASAATDPINGPGLQNGNSLSIVKPAGGAFVHVTNLTSTDLDFNYGWSNLKGFETQPVGYWIGVYDITESHYVWVSDTGAIEVPTNLKVKSLDTELTPGHEYYINFFVRDAYVPTATNVATLSLYFIAPSE